MMTQYEKLANKYKESSIRRASSATMYFDTDGEDSGSSYEENIQPLTNSDEVATVDPIANSLSDVTLELEPDNIKDVCNQWESKILSIDISSEDVTNNFAPLVGAEVATAYIPSLELALTKAENALLSINKIIKSTAEEHTGVENQYTGGGSYYGGGSYSGGGSSGDSPSGDYQFEIPTVIHIEDEIEKETPTTEVPTTKETPISEITINTEFVNKISELEADSYIKFMTVLGSIAGSSLLGYISDPKQASALKKVLLESPNLDPDLREMVSKMDENEVQVTLQSILTDKEIIPDMSKDIINGYTEIISQQTDIDFTKTTKELVFFSQVDDIFNTISTINHKDNLLDNLRSIYDGAADTQVSAESVNFVRSAVDVIAKNNDMSYEDLLADKAYEDLLKNELSDLEKSLSYFRTVNTMGPEAAQLLYDNAMKESG